MRDKETDAVLFAGSGFKTEEDAECQADMEAKEKNVKHYSIFTFRPPYEERSPKENRIW